MIANIITTNPVKRIIRRIRKGLPSNESGGIILGRVLPDRCILIEEITLPTEFDERGYYFFKRDRKTAQNIINQRWKESNGEVIYLGEWHTHNEYNPQPSKRDLEMIYNQVKTSIMEIDFLILFIIGINEDYLGIQKVNQHTIASLSNNVFYKCYKTKQNIFS